MKARSFYGAVVLTLAGCLSTPLPVERAPQTLPPGEQSAIGTPGNPPFYEVLGSRYHVLPSATGYRERGVASWYGEKFHGRNTSNGERYDMYALTAAHKTLPLPTWVKVTNLRNGASIVVKVNDRGPFVKNRLIDLSFSAASALDMIGSGTTLVEVEALAGQPAPAAAIVQAPGPTAAPQTRPYIGSEAGTASRLPPQVRAVSAPPPAIAVDVAGAATAPATTVAQSGSATLVWTPVYVQVGAFGDVGNARRLRTSLYNAAIENVRIANGERNGLPLYRVQVGPLDGVAEYDSLLARLETLGIVDTHLITE